MLKESIMQPEWRKWLSETLNTAVRFDEPMAAHTALGVGGPAWAYAAPESLSQLRILVKGAAQRQIPCWVIGSGSNLLVRDRGIPGLVICLHRCLSRIEETGRGRKVMVSAMAGVRLPVLCGYAQRRGFAGLEFAWGIPGTVGGAVFMNAGTASGAMADVVQSVSVLLPGNRIQRLEKETLSFSYRRLSCPVPDWDRGGAIILEASLGLRPENPGVLREKAVRILRQRRETQPVSAKSAGSFFKNPIGGKTAGELLDRAGLKGMTIGGAQISPKHANFIINLGNAAAADVLALMETARQAVLEKFGVYLETEVKIVGE
jgi:UDP-N-acetylmuramate dehydrogenase